MNTTANVILNANPLAPAGKAPGGNAGSNGLAERGGARVLARGAAEERGSPIGGIAGRQAAPRGKPSIGEDREASIRNGEESAASLVSFETLMRWLVASDVQIPANAADAGHRLGPELEAAARLEGLLSGSQAENAGAVQALADSAPGTVLARIGMLPQSEAAPLPEEIAALRAGMLSVQASPEKAAGSAVAEQSTEPPPFVNAAAGISADQELPAKLTPILTGLRQFMSQAKNPAADRSPSAAEIVSTGPLARAAPHPPAAESGKALPDPLGLQASETGETPTAPKTTTNRANEALIPEPTATSVQRPPEALAVESQPDVSMTGVAASSNPPQADAPSQAAAASPPPPAPAAADQVFEGLTAGAVRDGQQVVIRLNPPELGRVRITIQSDEDGVRGVLRVDSPRALMELQRESEELVDRLAAGGVNFRRLEVVLQQDATSSQRQPADGGAASWAWRDGQDSPYGQSDGGGETNDGRGGQVGAAGLPGDDADDPPDRAGAYHISDQSINVYM